VIVRVPKSGWPVLGQTEVNSGQTNLDRIIAAGILILEGFEHSAEIGGHGATPFRQNFIVA